MPSVAVTGACGYLGRLLVGLLDDDPEISRIVAIDTREPSFAASKLEFYSLDIRAPDLEGAISRCDVVVHLAASSRDPDEIRDVNVGGTRSVLDAADRNAVQKFVFASSHSVYGAHADNDFPLTEASPLRPNHENAFALSKAEAESVVSYFAEQHPDVVVTTLRFALTVGPNAPFNRHTAALERKVRFAVEGYSPPLQVLHEDDAAAALLFAVRNDIPGAFNVCADDVIDRPEDVLGQRRIELRVDQAKRMFDRTARMGLSPSSSDMSVLMYPRVMSNEALREVGFTPSHASTEALTQAVDARRHGRARNRRRVALVGGTLGALLIGSAIRGRRVRRVKPPGPA